MGVTALEAVSSKLGNVPPAYEHEERVATPQPPLVLPHAIFKWHHVQRGSESISEAMDNEARAVVRAEIAAGGWDPSYGLNFAVLHQSTAQAFLIVGIWRGHQELWARHYVKDRATDSPFARIDVSGQDAPLACVWELGVICHEREAWSRYLFSDRLAAAKRAWLEDVYQGAV